VALPVVQFVERPDLVDLGWGHPRPTLLPVAEWARASAAALRGYGSSALAYGFAAGPGPLVEWLAGRLRVPPEEFFVSAGASQALELVCAVLVSRDDTVLVDAPTYHLALRILGDHAGSVVPVPDLARLDPLVAELRAAGRRVPLLYLVPTFGNPTGMSLSGRAELVAAAARLGLTVVEDDTYRELAFDAPAPVALYDLARGDGSVVRIGSFAKSVAPGLRLGWVNAPPALIARLVERGYVFSGGGVNHATALAMAEFGASGAYDAHLGVLRSAYREQRDALVSALRADAPGLTFEVPGGGWFVWVRLPAGRDAEALLPRAEECGVSYVPGTRFGGGPDYLRLSFSMLEPAALAEGARRLAAALA
jgi:2-aminoadipate transaminase